METLAKTKITVEAIVSAAVEKVWDLWTDPKHVVHWNHASADWHSPYSENDLRVGGKFLYRMEARDGSSGFDFGGEYNSIELYKHIEYFLGDNRRVRVTFDPKGTGTRVTEIFETELTNSVELQQQGWQAILDNFKHYVESSKLEVLHFEIEINCDPEKVYKTMIDRDSYNEWTSIFNYDSHFEGSWQKGSSINFLGAGQDGSVEGMISRIKENIPNKFISIEHIGIIKNGIEMTCGPEVDEWQGALENYTFRPAGNKTVLSVDLDSNKGMSSYFMEAWPKALDKLKSICES